jgi:hypothetical protein
MTLVGSAGLLWHANRLGLDASLPENSMDVDPVTESDALAWMCYDALIGSEFERQRGWHVNLLPRSVLDELPTNWRERALSARYVATNPVTEKLASASKTMSIELLEDVTGFGNLLPVSCSPVSLASNVLLTLSPS